MVSAVASTPVVPSSFVSSAAPVDTAAPVSTASSATGFSPVDSFQPRSGGEVIDHLMKTMPSMPAAPTGADMKDEAKMMKYKEDMQRYTTIIGIITAVQQMVHEMLKSIVQNLRA